MKTLKGYNRAWSHKWRKNIYPVIHLAAVLVCIFCYVICQIISRQRSTDSPPAHFPILQIWIKSGWMVTLLHWKQIRYSQTIDRKCFLIIHLHWMCTPYDTHQKWSFDCFCLRVNYWNNKCVSATSSFTSRDIPIFFYCFVCLFGVFRPNRKFFTHLETSPLPVKGYKFWPWPLISEGSLACHTYCDTRRPLIIVISEDPFHSHLMPSI